MNAPRDTEALLQEALDAEFAVKVTVTTDGPGGEHVHFHEHGGVRHAHSHLHSMSRDVVEHAHSAETWLPPHRSTVLG